MNEKQQQLTFDKGITNVPSDALCSDNALEESLGMVYENGEHRVIQKPIEESFGGLTLGNGETLLYVHTYNGVTRPIVKYDTTDEHQVVHHHVGYRCWQDDPESQDVPPEQINVITDITEYDGGKVLVESIGNTLIVSISVGLTYCLWDYTTKTYKNLGNKIPDIRVRFSIDIPTDDPSPDGTGYPEKYISTDGMYDGVDYYDKTDPLNPILLGTGNKIAEGQYENLKTALIGLVASRNNFVKENGRFAFPFWARSAIRMYDGSHINISEPFLLMPSARNNWWIYVSESDGTEFDDREGGWPKVNYKPYSSKLYYKIIMPPDFVVGDLDDWEDIISGIDIFVSDEAKGFDMEGQWKIINTCDPADPIHVSGKEALLVDSCQPQYAQKMHSPTYVLNDMDTYRTYFKPTLLSDKDIIDELIKNSVFYNILELDMDDVRESIQSLNPIDSSEKMPRNVLKNLTTQTQLEYDDYFGRTNIVPQVVKTYNHRLHVANISRDFFDGFTDFSFTEYEGDTNDRTIKFYTYIKSESGERIVMSQRANMIPEIVDIWFYYPDPRAYKVEIYDGENKLVISLSLKEHPYLHGAYYFKRLPETGESEPTLTTQTEPTTNGDLPELLEDQLVVSEVDNPYIFTAKGYVTIGMGEIVGLASQTMSLGENEHGIHPILVFSEKGISLLRLNNEGIYIRSDEASREVAIKDNPCITETDGPVYFASERGLMLALGSQSGIQVKCVSDQLSGRDANFDGEIDLGNFVDYLRTAFIAYDYRDSLLWIFNGTSQYCYVYAIKSGTFGKYDFGVTNNVPNAVATAVNYYPDYLLQIGSTIYSLLQRPNINKDGSTTGGIFTPNKYACMMITRPMKLENALALKSIMQVRHITDFSDAAGIALEIYASNNLKTAQNTWVKLGSLRGKPWKYYRFRYDFTNLIATDRFAGSIIVTQERRTDKLR